MTLDLVLVGFGHVAQRFVTLLDEKRATLADTCGFSARIVAVATRGHGRAYSGRGLSGPSLVECRTRGETVGHHDLDLPIVDFIRAVASKGAAAEEGRLVVVETTTLNVAQGQPAIDHVRAALACGAHVVTANKGPVAFAYEPLAHAAAAAGRRFRFEGAVMDGIPIFNLVRETLPGVEIVGFRGVVNSTTNYMLTAMEEGQGFDEALDDMRAAGIAEADASLDTDGWDAAAKTAALANVLLGARLTPHGVERQGITAETGARAVAARRAGRRLKLVATAARQDRRVTARVVPIPSHAAGHSQGCCMHRSSRNASKGVWWRWARTWCLVPRTPWQHAWRPRQSVRRCTRSLSNAITSRSARVTDA